MNKQEVVTNPTHPVVVDQDVDVPMRDGAILKADVFRPYGDEKYPAILNLGPYQKDKLWLVPPALEEKQNDWMNWETVNPQWWVPRGYACVRVDGRGTGKSPGQCEPWSFAEAVDFYDAIEWAAAQPWCNGKVGLLGISYFAINQWFVANLQPPSLKAIIPWEGFADIYRDALYHGGIFNLFMTNWFTAHMLHHLLGRASREQPDGWQVNTLHFWLRNNLDSGAFARRAGAMGQDQRAALLGRQLVRLGAASARQHRSLHARRVAAQEAPHPSRLACASVLYRRRPAGSDPLPRLLAQGHRQRRDGRAAGEACDPQGRRRVRMAERAGMAAQAHALDQALSRPVGRAGDARRGRAAHRHAGDVKNPPATGSRSYPASSLGTMGSTSAASSQVMGGGIKPGMGVSLETPQLSVDTEITGPLACVLWVSSTTEDMDLFLTLRNIGPDGNEIMETGQQGAPVPVAKGWLRVSHRELDPDLSRPYRPYHKHQRRLYLTPGEIVKVEVEIWPTSMVFKKGHRIRLDIQPRDGIGSAQYMHYHADYNSGAINTIHAGGDKESYLLLPVIPAG